jgi:acyl-CoA reductase-like NAD-dependent aldehyde dehydrogenase
MLQQNPEDLDYFARHSTLLEHAAAAVVCRDHWNPYPESPSKSLYGEDAAKNGEAAFHRRLGTPFDLPGHPGQTWVAPTETSPYGFPLGISYPRLAPTWNGHPGLFAGLVTGNPVVVKPHLGAVLPLAITVRIAREVLAEAGFDANVVLLVAEGPDERSAGVLALHPDVRIIDFTGSTVFGDWLETHAHQAAVHTEKAGLNTVVLDSTDDYRGLLDNLAFSLSLYSGQMCTTPQNFLIPREGFATDQGLKSADEFAADLGAALDRLLSDPVRRPAPWEPS